MNEPLQSKLPASGFDATRIERPDKSLLKYYFVVSLLTGPFAPLAFLPLFFKYETLRYKFDASGVSMSWGILFRRETYLTYPRIQDIHLTRNIIQRWMGLATVSVQTASGSATPEMSIEGIRQADELRDYLYAKMRGAKGISASGAATSAASSQGAEAGDAATQDGEVLGLLHDIRDSLRKLAEQGGGR